MINLLGLIISVSIIIWALSVIWSIKEMVHSPLNNYDFSLIIISFISVTPIVNTVIAIILTFYNKKQIQKTMKITTIAGITRDIPISDIIDEPRASEYIENRSLLLVRGLGCVFVDEKCEHLKQRIKQEKQK